MYNLCPKCNYTRKAADTADRGVCPSCGLVFAKYDAVQSGASPGARRQAARAASDSGNGISWMVWVVGAVVAITGVAGFLHTPKEIKVPTQSVLPVANTRAMAPLTVMEEFVPLFESNTPLRKLAREGQYTVIEVYLDVCAYCRQLEAVLPDFVRKRPDVGIIRVHHPGAINLSISGRSAEEMQRNGEAMMAKMNSYSLCGTPHVEVYGPDRQPIAVDTCQKRDGVRYLWNWISKETGVRNQSPVGRTGI